MFSMRFDMRAPGGAAITERYRAAVDMAEFADTRGGVAAVLSEHHASPDGYLPSPLLLAAAMAPRTRKIHLAVSAVLLPFAEPIRLAEDMVVLDVLSGGRVSFTLGLGYRAEEFEHYGVDRATRGRACDEKIEVLLQAKTGEPFVHEGRRIHVTPAPVTPGGPRVVWGGVTVAGARRAGRYGLDYSPAANDPRFVEAYEDAARASGHPPGRVFEPEPGVASALFVADDVDAAWEEIGPHLAHDAAVYGAWNQAADNPANVSGASTVEGLRAEATTHQIVSVDEAIELVRGGQQLRLHPMCGGIPPEIAWPYLRRVTDEVLPAARPA
jgi:alkanesulfonate monooxygenase SsuD/methylene tetrahydromethanopterin reductase-like flavin-dependent oxidoreductase (luciferase family)